MKVKVFRTSGNPVDPKVADQYQEEWKTEFDKIWNDNSKPAQTRSEEVEELETRLQEKYNDLTVINMELPKSGKKWIEMLSEYGNVMMTTNVENGELLMVINDMPF